jgi:L-lactate dehydrogenase complex protein LldG
MAGWIGKFLTVLSGAPQAGGDEASEPQKPYAGITDPVDLAFVRTFTKSAGLFLYCGSADEVVENLKAVGAETGQSQFFVPEKSLHAWFAQAGLSVIYDNPLEADAMATTCHAAVAQTGGIMITDAQTQGLKFAQLPAIHLVVARVSQVVNSLSDGMSAINKYHREQRPLSIITLKGKRDEAVLQAKVDPNKGRELYFFLVEDHLFTDL